MGRDEQRLYDILAALDTVSRFVNSTSQAEFLANEMMRYAVAHQLSVVGEAAARVSIELRNRYPALPWTRIIGLRNVLVHDYFGIDWPVVWRTITEHAPALRKQIAEVVRTEFPDSGA